MGRRSKSREYAMISLFSHFVMGEGALDTFEFLLEERNPGEQVRDFAKVLIDGVILHQQEIDQMIRKHLQRWDFDRVANLEKILLRIGSFELKYCPATPISVIMDEVFHLCDDYSTENSVKFLNGVLGAIAREVRKDFDISYQYVRQDNGEEEDIFSLEEE